MFAELCWGSGWGVFGQIFRWPSFPALELLPWCSSWSYVEFLRNLCPGKAWCVSMSVLCSYVADLSLAVMNGVRGTAGVWSKCWVLFTERIVRGARRFYKPFFFEFLSVSSAKGYVSKLLGVSPESWINQTVYVVCAVSSVRYVSHFEWSGTTAE